MSDFIDQNLIVISDCPENFIPANCKEFSYEEDGTVVKGFYDPQTETTHIQGIQTWP